MLRGFLCDNERPDILAFAPLHFVSKINSRDNARDRVFARPWSEVRAFEFDDEVARVFDDMIGRSVPGYDLLLRLIALHADVFAQPVVLNLTLQFIEPEHRQVLLQDIYRGLRPGGALVLTEKIRHDDPALQQRMTELYQAFKKTQGYSDLEISQKRSALERVLVPDTEAKHVKRLREAGFATVDECFRGLLFVSWLAVKS